MMPRATNPIEAAEEILTYFRCEKMRNTKNFKEAFHFDDATYLFMVKLVEVYKERLKKKEN